MATKKRKTPSVYATLRDWLAREEGGAIQVGTSAQTAEFLSLLGRRWGAMPTSEALMEFLGLIEATSRPRRKR